MTMKTRNEFTAIWGAFIIFTALAASAADYTLGVYGNANMDETIDEQDISYVKDVIRGAKPVTNLADANYDGKVNEGDIIQIEQIISGEEKQLTVESGNPWSESAIVTINKPINTVLTRFFDSAEVLRTLDLTDRIIAVGSKDFQENSLFFPELCNLPYVADIRYDEPDNEAVLSLKPDLFLGWSGEEREKLPGITMVHSKLYGLNCTRDLKKIGYIFDKEKEIDEYIQWHDSWINEIKRQVGAITEDKRPEVLVGMLKSGGVFAVYNGAGGSRGMDEMMNMVPMNSLGQKFAIGDMPEVDMEWVIEQNPDIIIIASSIAGEGKTSYSGYNLDDPSLITAERADFLNRTELAEVSAVKNGRVYMMEYKLFTYSQSMIIGAAYLAKWIYPELDLNPEAIHQEYLNKYQKIDFDLNEHGVFAYPPIEVEGGLAGIPDKWA
jgi:iron complex transport system substrate-binding protein